VERDVAYWTVPGTDRQLLADLWQPPEGTQPSGLAFIYRHGGGHASGDKGGPTEPWFRHLAAQGHVVMDVAYRFCPETNVPGMQGDVKRAIVWMKRNAAHYGGGWRRRRGHRLCAMPCGRVEQWWLCSPTTDLRRLANCWSLRDGGRCAPQRLFSRMSETSSPCTAPAVLALRHRGSA
jgi:hypothetical protein